VSERFYSGGRDGQVTVRDGIGAASKRPLPPTRLFKTRRKGDQPGSATAQEARKLPLPLSRRPLGDEARAMAMHENFQPSRGRTFPERWTISRTRVLSY